MRYLLLALLLCGCAETTAPVAPDPTIRVTASVPSMWLVALDSATGERFGIVMLGAAAPLDTARITSRDSTIVYGVKLNTGGFPVCHDWRSAKRGEVVTLDCQPYIAP